MTVKEAAVRVAALRAEVEAIRDAVTLAPKVNMVPGPTPETDPATHALMEMRHGLDMAVGGLGQARAAAAKNIGEVVLAGS